MSQRLSPVASPVAASASLDALAVTAVIRPFVVTDRQWTGEPVIHAFRRLAAELNAREANLLSLMVYASVGARDEINVAMNAALGRPHWPVTWIDSRNAVCTPLAGFQAFAVSNRVPVTRLRIDQRVVGSVFEDGTARHCLIGGVGPTSTALRPGAQAQQTLVNLGLALSLAGFGLCDVVRTWFYNDDIVAWYGDFNRVRSFHYAQAPFRAGSAPASTGIGARNSSGAALTMAAWAMQPFDDQAVAHEVGSPLQCPASAYGSLFSRAMEIICGDTRRLFVSGTASIWPDGRTAWLGDAPKQIDLTMAVVEAILRSRGMGFLQITRATAYFRNISDKGHFDAWCERHEVRRLPVVAVEADICRSDLWFEIEVDAEASTGDSLRVPSFEI